MRQKLGAMTNNDLNNTAPQLEISPSSFFAFIDRFLAGTNDAEVARESVGLLGSLPQSVTPTCLLIGIITHKRIGDVAKAHQLVQVLNRIASGWDLPGIPTKGVDRLQELAKFRGQIDDRRLDWALFEEADLNPILDILRALQVNAMKTEADALLSLIRQYEARQEQLQKQHSK